MTTAHPQIWQTLPLQEADRTIILATQNGLPLVSRPFAAIADQLGMTEAEVLHRLEQMQRSGVLRRVAAVPNHYKMGYRANAMTVWDIPDDQIDDVGHAVAALHCVSHCYRRPRALPLWPYNLFAMVHAHTRDEAMTLVDQVRQVVAGRARSHDVLFSKRILKKTGLRLRPEG